MVGQPCWKSRRQYNHDTSVVASFHGMHGTQQVHGINVARHYPNCDAIINPHSGNQAIRIFATTHSLCVPGLSRPHCPITEVYFGLYHRQDTRKITEGSTKMYLCSQTRMLRAIVAPRRPNPCSGIFHTHMSTQHVSTMTEPNNVHLYIILRH